MARKKKGVDGSKFSSVTGTIDLESTKKLNILNALGDPIIIVNTKGEFEFLNKAAIDLTGEKDAVGKKFVNVSFITKKSKLLFAKNIDLKVLKNKDTDKYEIEVLDKQRNVKIYELHLIDLFHEGKLTGILGIFRDNTPCRKEQNIIKNERKFSDMVFNSIESILLILDNNANILKFNVYMEKLTGYKLEEVKGKNWFDTFLPKGDHTKIKKVFKESLKNEQSKGVINPILAKNGNKILIRWNNQVLKERDGKIIGLLSFGMNLTTMRKIESELSMKKLYSDTIMASIGEGVDIVDENMKILYMNDTFKKNFSQKAIGKKCFEVYKDDKKQCLQCPLKTDIKIGETKKIVTKDVAGGNIFEITHTGIEIEDGKKAVLEVFRNITEQKKFERRLIEETEKLERFKKATVQQIILFKNIEEENRKLKKEIERLGKK